MIQRILVVEDNALNLELLSDWLEMEGFEIQTATDLKSAFASVESFPPDAVLLDVQLGGEDGLALAEWLRQQPALRRIPVIAVTAHALASEQERILQSGCNVCVPKPVDLNSLRENLRRLLTYSQSSQASA
jgi:two-component system cell cycle response regulator DivK